MAARVSFSIRTKDPGSYARTGTLKLAHGEVRTPAFVPLATKAVVKTLEVREAGELGFDMVLGNTFHLFLSPGHDLIAKLGEGKKNLVVLDLAPGLTTPGGKLKPECYTADHLHLAAPGYEAWAAALRPAFEKPGIK